MPFRRPTLSGLVQQALAIFAGKLPGADATLPKSNIAISARIMAAMTHGVFGYADWLARQALPNTADDWFYLLRWGALFGLTPRPAAISSGNALFTGTATTVVPVHTQLQDSLQNLYRTTSSVTLGAGNTSAPIEALTGGAAGNLAAGAIVSLVSAIVGVNGTANVDGSGLSGGLDAETPQAFGARIADRVKNPPSIAGRKQDYEGAVLGISGVTRATANGRERGAGTVNIRFVMDGQANPIPTSGQVAAVQAVVDAERPVTDDALVLAPVAQPVNYRLADALVPQEDRDGIAQSLAAMHLGLAIGAGLSIQGQVIPAITAVASLSGTFLLAPTVDVAPDPSVVLTLGTIDYV